MDTHDPAAYHQRTAQSLRIDAEAAPAPPLSPLDSPETPASASLRRPSANAFSVPPSAFSPVTTSPTSGPQRTSRPSTATSTRSSGSKDDGTVKRKRSRVTPDQLIQLERLFAEDRSPTAAKRKEISELLGMQERQTQIWYQNRRAKAKNLDGKGKAGRNSGSPPNTPPEHLSGQFDHVRLSLVHEDHPVIFLPCDELTVGTWRRIANVTGSHYDLLAYSCDAKRSLVWFIQSDNNGFKIEIPYDLVARVHVAAAERPGFAQVSFFLSGKPNFYLETQVPSPAMPGAMIRSWCLSQDWTERSQGSSVMEHQVVAPYGAIASALRMLPFASRTTGLDIAPPPPPPMQLPPPPLASLQGGSLMSISFPFTGEQAAAAAPLPHLMGRRRSLSGPTSTRALHQQPGFAASTGQLPQYVDQNSVRPSTMQYGVATYQNHSQESLFRYMPPGLAQHSPSQTSLGDYSAPPSASYGSQLLPPGSAGGMMQSSVYDASAEHVQDISRFATASTQHAFGSSSPDLLTQPFNPGVAPMQMHDLYPSMAPPTVHDFDPPMSAGAVPSPMGTAISSDVRSISQKSSGSSLDGALGLSMPPGTSPSQQ